MILLKLVRYSIVMMASFITAFYLFDTSSLVTAAREGPRVGKFVSIDARPDVNYSKPKSLLEWGQEVIARFTDEADGPTTASGASLQALQDRRAGDTGNATLGFSQDVTRTRTRLTKTEAGDAPAAPSTFKTASPAIALETESVVDRSRRAAEGVEP